MIEIEDLELRINSQSIFNEINLKIIEPQIIKISGRNGSGKTSFIKCIIGLISNFSGSLKINGIDFRDKNKYLTQNQQIISFLLNNLPIYPNFTVLENIQIFNQYLLQKQTPDYIEDLIEKFKLMELKNIKAGKLSAGNQQKLGIIICFLKDCNYYLLDEPIKNLDEESINIFYEFVKKNFKERSKTYLIVSHQDKLLSNLATQNLLFN